MNIAEIAPKIISDGGSELLIIIPKLEHKIIPAKEPIIDLFQIFPNGNALPTIEATESPMHKNNSAKTAISNSNSKTVKVNPISIHVAPVN